MKEDEFMKEKIVLRNAIHKDLEAIVDIFNKATEKMIDHGINQWDDLYPNEEILINDINSNQMLVGEIDHQIASVLVINQTYDEEYRNGDWMYKDTFFCVVHRLCINPVFQGKGFGMITMQLIENTLRSNGIESIRLDAFSQNPIALRMYEKLGYKKVGEVTWRKGLFYLLEKNLMN